MKLPTAPRAQYDFPSPPVTFPSGIGGYRLRVRGSSGGGGFLIHALHLLSTADLRVRHLFRTGTSFLVDQLGPALFAQITISDFTWHLNLLFVSRFGPSVQPNHISRKAPMRRRL